MSAESDKAGRIARKGLDVLDKCLDVLAGVPYINWSKTHVRDVADCVMAAVKYQAEEREQLSFEAKAELSPEDIRAALKAHLAEMTVHDFRVLVADARPEFALVLGESGVSPSAAHV